MRNPSETWRGRQGQRRLHERQRQSGDSFIDGKELIAAVATLPGPPGSIPLGGMRCREFLVAVATLSSERANKGTEASRTAVRQAAVAAAHKEFTKLEQFNMTTAEEAGRWTIHPERDTTVPWRAKKSTMLIARPRLLWRDGAHNEDQGEAQRAEFPSPGRRGERQTYTTLLHPVRTTPLTVSSHHSAHAPKAPNRVVCIFYFSVRVTPKPRWSINNNRDNDNNCKNNDNCDSLRPGGNVADHGTHSGHNRNVRSNPAEQTCCAPTRRQQHQQQHSTRSGQQQPGQPQGTDKSMNGARDHAANAVAQTSVQEELAVDFFTKK